MNYETALEYARKKHEGQYRKGNDIQKEYIEHPIEVSELINLYLKDNPNKEKYRIVALLHDTLEDTTATYEEEKELFGEKIANMVLALTNDEKELKKLGKDVYLANKLLHMDDDILSIKLCDRLTNIKDLMISGIDFRKKYISDTIYILDNLLINRKLNEVHLVIINDIFLEVKETMKKSNLNINLNRETVIYE